MSNKEQKHVVVVVLGDLGRSPRMNYHALSLLELGHQVTLIGYDGEDVIPELQKYNDASLQEIRFTPYSPSPVLRKILPVYYILRLLGLIFGLVMALKRIDGDPDCILVQNPPSTPLMPIAHLYCLLKKTSSGKRPGFIIDWHNLGFSMFGGGPNNIIKNIAYRIEMYMSSKASGHLCVTKAMKEWLIQSFSLDAEKISVLYDRPQEAFRPTDVEDMHDLMLRLKSDLEKQVPCLSIESDHETIMTKEITINGEKKIHARDDKGRPVLLVSSTSWTPDEDFSILLQALIEVDRQIIECQDFYPNILVIVTGKGPQKKMYQDLIAKLPLKHVFIATLWLEIADYPKLLGCADVGVSLHTSTSGLDLPMKVLDMFGCEVPVCAVNFDCLDELVKNGDNSLIFSTPTELSNQLFGLLKAPRNPTQKVSGDLAKFRASLKGMTKWRKNWKDQALDLIMNSCSTLESDSSKPFKQMKQE